MIEIAVRDYLRSQPAVTSLLNDDPARLNIEWKGDVRATRITLYRSGGGLHYYVPLDHAALTLNVYGSTRPAAAQLADAVIGALWRVTNADEPLQCCEVESVFWLPASEGAARYVVITQVTAHTNPAAA